MSEQDQLEAISADYIAKGYAVTIDPLPADRPPFLRRFRPDALAIKRDDHVVLEVKTHASLRSDAGLRSLASVIEAEPGWRLEVVVVRGALRKPPEGGAPSLSAIGRDADLIEAAHLMLEHGLVEPAFVSAWVAFEASFRLALEREKVDTSRMRPEGVVKTLWSSGWFVDSDERKYLESLWAARNQLVHGFASARTPTKEDTQFVMRLADRLSRGEDPLSD